MTEMHKKRKMNNKTLSKMKYEKQKLTSKA